MSQATLQHIADLLHEANRLQQLVLDGDECYEIHNTLESLVGRFDELAAEAGDVKDGEDH